MDRIVRTPLKRVKTVHGQALNTSCELACPEYGRGKREVLDRIHFWVVSF